MVNACFVTHLYCRYSATSGIQALHPGDFDARHFSEPAEFTGRTWSATKRAARKAGYRFGRDGDVTCPACVKHGSGWHRPDDLPRAIVRRERAIVRRERG